MITTQLVTPTHSNEEQTSITFPSQTDLSDLTTNLLSKPSLNAVPSSAVVDEEKKGRKKKRTNRKRPRKKDYNKELATTEVDASSSSAAASNSTPQKTEV